RHHRDALGRRARRRRRAAAAAQAVVAARRAGARLSGPAAAAVRHGARRLRHLGAAERAGKEPLREFSLTPAIAAVVAMYGAFMAVGWFASRKVRDGTAADLIVAGRQMPMWIAALTMTATWVDGGDLLGTTEGVYRSSIQLGIQGGLSFGLSLIIVGAVFAGIMRR